MYQGISRALVTGITGQDGFLSAKMLLTRNVKVLGFSRQFNSRIHLLEKNDPSFSSFVPKRNYFSELKDEILRFRPHLILHWAGPQPKEVEENEVLANRFAESSLCAIFEAASQVRLDQEAVKIMVPGSSEFFHKDGLPKNIESNLRSDTPYARNKILIRSTTKKLSEVHGLSVFFPILYSHDSPLRDRTFLSRQIYDFFLNIQHSYETLRIGPLETMRDWSWAEEVIEIVIFQTLQNVGFKEVVVGHGRLTSIDKMIELFAKSMDLNFHYQSRVIIDSQRVRPQEILGSYPDSESKNTILTSQPPSEWIPKYVRQARTLLSQ